MGLHERTEEIHASNLERGTPPEAGSTPPSDVSPFVSMWFRPRQTILRVVAHESELWILAIAVAVGISRVLTRVAMRNYGDRHRLHVIIIGTVILGPIIELFTIYVGGAILHAYGTLFRSRATYAEVRAAVAWGSLPLAAMVVPWILALGILGGEMFTSVKPTVQLHPSLDYFLYVFYGVDLIAIVWSALLILGASTAVFRRPLRYVLLTCLVNACLVVATFAAWYGARMAFMAL